MYSYLHDEKHSGQLNNPAKTSIEISEMVPIKIKKEYLVTFSQVME